MPPSILVNVLQVIAPTIAISTSTAIASYSFHITPLIISISQEPISSPSTALKLLRPYFENGKYIFPPLSILCTLLFLSLAYLDPGKIWGYGVAVIGSIGIIPFTSGYMIPITNNRILDMDDMAKQSREGREKVDKRGEEVRRLMGEFKRENYVRAGMFFVGGVVGLITALM